MVEYRRCCRRLCRALGEARKVSDASTVAVLGEIILKLEKQLWLIDKPRHDPGTERYRSVSLFLTC
jgi:DNA-binding ferritin-like protein